MSGVRGDGVQPNGDARLSGWPSGWPSGCVNGFRSGGCGGCWSSDGLLMVLQFSSASLKEFLLASSSYVPQSAPPPCDWLSSGSSSS